jgi:hypothetical protein
MSVRIQRHVWYSALKGTDMLVMQALADCADDEGYAWPYNTHLAWKTGLSRPTISAVLKKFREKRYLIGKPTKGETSARYRIAVENLPTKTPWREIKRGPLQSPVKDDHTPLSNRATPPVKYADTPVKQDDTPCKAGRHPL